MLVEVGVQCPGISLPSRAEPKRLTAERRDELESLANTVFVSSIRLCTDLKPTLVQGVNGSYTQTRRFTRKTLPLFFLRIERREYIFIQFLVNMRLLGNGGEAELLHTSLDEIADPVYHVLR